MADAEGRRLRRRRQTLQKQKTNLFGLLLPLPRRSAKRSLRSLRLPRLALTELPGARRGEAGITSYQHAARRLRSPRRASRSSTETTHFKSL